MGTKNKKTDKRLNMVVGDPIGKAYLHLDFVTIGTKTIGQVKRDSPFSDSKFRSFSYATLSSDAVDSLCMEFFDRVMRGWV